MAAYQAALSAKISRNRMFAKPVLYWTAGCCPAIRPDDAANEMKLGRPSQNVNVVFR
jgi:hypothetical protein